MSRKYRQQGYRESEREERDRPKGPPRSTLSPEERIHRRSLRHAIDRDANEVLRCHNCGRTAQEIGAVTAETHCPHCAAPLHCCRTCANFDPAARWQCRAPIEAPVGDKTKANTCVEYRARLVLDVTGRRTSNGTTGRADDPKARFENLFKR